MKRFFFLPFLLIAMVLGACSKDESDDGGNFDNTDIEIKVTHQYKNDYFIGYAINVTNNTKVPISYFDMYLSFPVLEKEGTKQNHFVLVGVPHKNDVELESGEAIEFVFEGYLDVINQEKVDLENPQIELKGYVEEIIPFGMVGQLNVLKKDDNK